MGFLTSAVESNWIAPAGPDLDQFEKELAASTGRKFCVGLSSGTAALHLALLAAGVKAGDEVLCSSLTFVASANAIHYVGAEPVFVDSEPHGWNLDPELLRSELERRAAVGSLPAAVVAVDLYGQCARYDEIVADCERFGVPLIEDSAEALGSNYHGRPGGAFGLASILSFNGNKIITASGGGALVTDDEEFAARVRHLATQAREATLHYEHVDRGYNYRLSNLLAAFGRGQLATLEERVDRRREFNRRYRDLLAGLPGVSFLEEYEDSRCTFWLTTLTVDPDQSRFSAADLIAGLARDDIESRPVWKPMHLQPAYESSPAIVNGVSQRLFEHGICLPSGSGMTEEDFERVTLAIQRITA